MSNDPHIITDAATLRAVVGAEIPGLALKVERVLTQDARAFIAASPFLVLSTCNTNGGLDASPKGDGPGFVQVADDVTLLIPDRPGNKLVFGHLNILSNPQVGVLSNYSGGLHEADPVSIRTRLFFQLFNPVNWVGCLNTAIAEQVTTFIEFGGGLGAEDGPATKRPNLESIIRKTLKAGGIEARHHSAINSETLRAAAAAFAG